MLSEKEILEFLDESRWVPRLPDLSILKRHVGNLDGADRKILCSLIDGPQDIPELVSAATLIWHLNAGGRRHYRIVARPDREVRIEPRPDFLLSDKVSGHSIALEVSDVFHHRDTSGVLPLKRKVVAALRELLYEGRDIAMQSGLFHVVVGAGEMRGLQLDDVAHELAVSILKTARHMDMGHRVTLTGPFKVALERRGLHEGSATFFVETEEDHLLVGQAREKILQAAAEGRDREVDPNEFYDRWIAEWSIPPQFVAGFRRAISETESKFRFMPDIDTALLVTLRWTLFLDEAWLYVDRLQHFSDQVEAVDRFYLKYVDDRSSQSRIRRVW